MDKPLPQPLTDRLRDLAGSLPPYSEMARLLDSLDDPASDETSKDRYVALVAASAVEGALRLALDVQGGHKAGKTHTSFSARIDQAAARGIVSPKEAVELHRIRLVRNVFAHALVPVSFSTPEVVEVTALFWDHPVTDFASYFLPAFPARHRFAIVCGEFFKKLQPADTPPPSK